MRKGGEERGEYKKNIRKEKKIKRGEKMTKGEIIRQEKMRQQEKMHEEKKDDEMPPQLVGMALGSESCSCLYFFLV